MTKWNRGVLHISIESKAKIIAATMAIVALFCPYVFSYYYEVFDGIYVIEMMSLTWIHYSNVLPFFIFYPPLFVNNPINTLLRFWFVFEMYRCYTRKSSVRRAIYVGLINEIWQLSIMTYYLFYSLHFPVFQLFFAPIPLLLIVGVVILLVVKPPKPLGLWTQETDESIESKSTDHFLSE